MPKVLSAEIDQDDFGVILDHKPMAAGNVALRGYTCLKGSGRAIVFATGKDTIFA